MAYPPSAWDAEIPTKRGDGSDWVPCVVLSCLIVHLFISPNPGEGGFTDARSTVENVKRCEIYSSQIRRVQVWVGCVSPRFLPNLRDELSMPMPGVRLLALW